MKGKRFNHFLHSYRRLLLPAILLLALLLFAAFPQLVEEYYSTWVFPFVSRLVRQLFGWVPFSINDSLVVILVLYLFFKFFRLSKAKGSMREVLRHMFGRQKWWAAVLWFLVAGYFLWGLSYYRMGSSYQLELTLNQYTTADLDTLLTHLNERLFVVCADSAGIEKSKTKEKKVLSGMSVNTYNQAAEKFPFLAFKHASTKPMLIGRLQSYAGYSGYVSPFTGEAHVDFNMPAFELPFTLSHEMAHQLGFGKESEANMVAFLACTHGKNDLFKYSAYSNMQYYALREMKHRDSLLFSKHLINVPPLLIKDRKEEEEFIRLHRNVFQPLLNGFYDLFLRVNNQPLGLESYNYVVAWLIAYGKKYGWEAL